MRQGCAAKTRTARKIPFEEGPRLAPGGRRARLDVEARLARALQENTAAARVIYLRRRGAEPWSAGHRQYPCLTNRQRRNGLAMDVERLALQIAVGRQGGALDAVCRAVLQPVIEDFSDLAADADRSVGSRDQERAGEAASRQRYAR